MDDGDGCMETCIDDCNMTSLSFKNRILPKTNPTWVWIPILICDDEL